jgi:hypothetical protein
MALAAYALPFGVRDIKLKTKDPVTGALGSAVDLPAARTLSFAEAEDFTELRGDDSLIASHGNGPTVDWDLEGGGISLAAYAVMAGGTVTQTGTTPNIKNTYSKTSLVNRPFFQIEGQAISDSGGDFHVLIYKAKATDNLEGEMGEGAFWLSSASGKGFGSSTDTNKIYDFIHNESETAIT